MDAVPTELLVLHGRACRIAYARAANGRLYAKEFLDADASNKDRAAVQRILERIAQVGRVSNEEKFKKLRGEIWEIKSYQARIGLFRIEDVWYLTHGFVKKRAKTPSGEIERAERIRAEHIEWLARRTGRG